jgi:hypothetical protein
VLSTARPISGRRRQAVTGLLLGAAALTVAYWLLWFAGGRELLASDTSGAYYAFENAFPLADSWFVLCLVAAAVQLHRRRPTALLWLLAAGASALYLAGMDILYDLEHGIWFAGRAGGLVELAINVATVAVGIGLLVWTWRSREALLAGA